MSDDQERKVAFYGKTAKIKLADGNIYTFRELNLWTLDAIDADLSDAEQLKNTKTIRKMAYAMLKTDHPELTEQEFGNLVTMSMLKEENDFIKTIIDLMGGGTGKNDGATNQSHGAR